MLIIGPQVSRSFSRPFVDDKTAKTKEELQKEARNRELQITALEVVITGLEVVRDTAFLVNPIFWPFTLSGCAPGTDKFDEGGASIDTIKLTAVTDEGSPLFEVGNISFMGNEDIGPFNTYARIGGSTSYTIKSMPLTIGTDNEQVVAGFLADGIDACQPGAVRKCAPSSCRVINAGVILDDGIVYPDGKNWEVAGGSLNFGVMSDPDAPSGVRSVVVNLVGGTKVEYGSAFDAVPGTLQNVSIPTDIVSAGDIADIMIMDPAPDMCTYDIFDPLFDMTYEAKGALQLDYWRLSTMYDPDPFDPTVFRGTPTYGRQLTNIWPNALPMTMNYVEICEKHVNKCVRVGQGKKLEDFSLIAAGIQPYPFRIDLLKLPGRDGEVISTYIENSRAPETYMSINWGINASDIPAGTSAGSAQYYLRADLQVNPNE